MLRSLLKRYLLSEAFLIKKQQNKTIAAPLNPLILFNFLALFLFSLALSTT